MDLNLTRRILCVWLWTIACWVDVLGQGTRAGAVPRLSKKDVLLLANDADPKCFTRTQYDFTCFWEMPDNKSYDFFYSNDDREEKRCNLILQRTEEGQVLHICSFPPSDVFLFTFIHIRVMESSSNYTLYTRTVSVEDQVLLDPPVNVSLHPTGQTGQFQVAWHTPREWENNMQYGIRYSSQSLRERTELIKPVRSQIHSLVSLAPGEMVSVQLRVKPNGYSKKEISCHWSDWSVPKTAMVPQSAADISLLCHTSDLQNITCQWNGQAYRDDTYTIYYKLGSSEREGWRECMQNENISYHCSFHGAESSEIRVKLSAGPATPRRTFYTEPFRLNNSIQTAPPGRLRGQWEKGRLCLKWDTPLLALSVHLMYQHRYQPREETVWKLVILQGPETSTCLDIQTGVQYYIQIRARPNGSVYAGYWSNWSPRLTVDTPSDIGALIACIPLMMLVVSIVFISIFSRYLSKLKQYLWPPVPNLDKVLHVHRGLTDLDHLKGEAPGRGMIPRESPLLLSPEQGTSDGVEESLPTLVLEVSPDYVTLTTDDVIPRLRGNEYVYDGEVGAESRSLGVGGEEVLQVRCHCSFTRSSSFPSSSSTTDILNRSYLLLAEQPIERLDCPGQQGAPEGSRVYVNLEGTSSANPNA
uniref:MPL proto-oncogene, thrombopoietin receptor n=1 Tax=Hucho hucho TaxID=62062 RepID=A0A4W5PE50_9TELE